LYIVQPSAGGYPVPTHSVLVSYVQRQLCLEMLSPSITCGNDPLF